MKIDFNFQLKDLSGKEIPDAHAGKILGNSLSMLNKGNSIKLFDWALKVFNNKPLEIDDTDTKVLEEIIESSETITVLAKAQLKQQIEKCRAKK